MVFNLLLIFFFFCCCVIWAKQSNIWCYQFGAMQCKSNQVIIMLLPTDYPFTTKRVYRVHTVFGNLYDKFPHICEEKKRRNQMHLYIFLIIIKCSFFWSDIEFGQHEASFIWLSGTEDSQKMGYLKIHNSTTTVHINIKCAVAAKIKSKPNAVYFRICIK